MVEISFSREKTEYPFWLFFPGCSGNRLGIWNQCDWDYSEPGSIWLFSGVCYSALLLLKSPYFGFYFLIAFSSITITIDRLVDPPLPSGTLVEIITYFILLSLIVEI